MAQLVTIDKKRVRSVYDPTCGSGSLLLRIREFTEVTDYFGQELNPTTYNLARMNMILHGVHFDNFSIRQGDTLTDDMHLGLQAEAIVANPPFSADWKGDADPILVHDDRFSQYGRLAPKSVADYAFVTHMIHHLAENGTMAVLLPHGALSHSEAEGVIRRYIIEKQNFLDAVIGLPANLFYGTSMPTAILVLKKCRNENDDIIFIDASMEFEKGKKKNVLTDENINKIFDVYKSRKRVDRFSNLISLNQIKQKKYNLSIPLYVDTYEEEEEIDLEAITAQIRDYNIKLEDVGIDERLEFYEGRKAYLASFKKGLIQKLFNKKINFKKTDGKEFKKWESISFRELLIESEEVTTVQDQYPALSSTVNGMHLQSEYFNTKIISKNNIGYKILKRNQLVLSPQNIWLGNINVNTSFETGIVSPSYKVFNVNTDIILISYLKYLIKTSRLIYEYKAASEQGASVVRRNLNMDLFYSIQVKLPTKEEQELIAEIILAYEYGYMQKKIIELSKQLHIEPPFSNS